MKTALLRFFRNKWVKRLLLPPLAGFLLFLLLDVLFPVSTALQYSAVITDSEGKVLHCYLSPDHKWRMKSDVKDLTPQLLKAIVTKEDKWFYYHPGINPVAVCRAVFQNVLSLQRKSGASTITMQVARMLNRGPRTWWQKLKEAFRALQLEWHCSKSDILQLYVDLLPYGGNIEGVKAASLLYFGKDPNYLSVAQAATLAVIPNRPTSMRPGRNDTLLAAYRNRWLMALKAEGVFTAKEIADALNEPLNARRLPVPRLAPHLCNRLRGEYQHQNTLATTLNSHIQAQVELLCRNHCIRLRQQQVWNASVIVVENKTRRVLAYVGNPWHNDSRHAGQVDGAAAVRSPGSTLKPLVFGIGIDKGIITPKTILADVPVQFDGYEPENYTRSFAGNVSVEQSLALSLNIPAVKALNMIGLNTMTDRMYEAGFTHVHHQRKKLGLSLVLGGCGVSLYELAGLYCSFANGGMFAHLKLLNADSSRTGKQLISQPAAFMLGEMLSQLVRPDLPREYSSSTHLPRVAWKTGTSYGRRDAWSIGYNSRYTVAVWIGNFDGSGVSSLTGNEMATPLMFDIFNTIDYCSQTPWLKAPPGLDFRIVCTESGQPPGPHCTATATDYFMPGISKAEPCTHITEVKVSPDGRMSYCTTCQPEAGYRTLLYDNPTADLADWLEKENRHLHKPPAHNPACTRVLSDAPPKITSPVSGKEYLMERGEMQQLMLTCQVGSGVSQVYWYIDDRLLQQAPATEKVFFTPSPGRIKISCTDDRGRNTNLYVQVGVF